MYYAVLYGSASPARTAMLRMYRMYVLAPDELQDATGENAAEKSILTTNRTESSSSSNSLIFDE